MTYTDDSIMPFGKYKGRRLEDVPAGYLIWLYDNGLDRGPLREYIEENKDALEKEISKES